MTPLVDHVVINVRDGLDAAQRRYEDLGFTMTPRGHHTLGSSNHLAIFGQDYLELLGAEPGRQAVRMDVIDHPLGLAGLAFKPSGADFVEALHARGVAIGPARDFSRPVDLSGGAQEARFRTANLADDRIVNGRVFLCHHHTPELVWRHAWRAHANGAVGVAGIVIAAHDPGRTAGPYRDLFGAGAVSSAAGACTLPAGPASVRFMTPPDVAREFGDAAPRQADGSDRMVALGLRVRDIGATAAVLGRPVVQGRVTVPHEAAAGVCLVFQA